jgi:hypothetical protein
MNQEEDRVVLLLPPDTTYIVKEVPLDHPLMSTIEICTAIDRVDLALAQTISLLRLDLEEIDHYVVDLMLLQQCQKRGESSLLRLIHLNVLLIQNTVVCPESRAKIHGSKILITED